VKWREPHKARLSEGKRLKKEGWLSDEARLQSWNKEDEDACRASRGWRKM
jgi:hypothetical protein